MPDTAVGSPPSRRVRLLVERLAVVALLGVAVACGRSGRETVRAIPAPPVPPVAPPPAVVEALPPAPRDPIEVLLEASNEHFKTGQAELEAGHVTAAKEHFDTALNLLIESPYGGRTEPRIREQFDRLVDRISTYEIRALTQGDGFTEREALEPASIDELLAVSASLIPADDDTVMRATRIEPTSDADFPIPRNARVDSFITLFQGRLHEFLEEGMRRGSQYLPMIQSVFREEGLPLDLAFVPLVESAFKTSAFSRAKARGVWQFMRGTGLENGLRQDWYVDERADPEKATVAAAKYLNSLVRAFDGDWLLALASYNGGPGRLQRAIKRGKKTDFWELSARRGLLPRETRDYVPMIMAAIIIARNPVQYGFTPDILPPTDYETVELPRAVDLRRIAEWTESSVDVIQTLNPELRRWTTPVNDDDYELRVPRGTAVAVKTRIEESASDELATLNWHVVKKGETLATVARNLRVSRTDLAEANYLKTTARIAAGQKLIVPRETTVLMAARADRPVPVADSRPLAADTVVAAVNPPEPTTPVKVSYRIRRGDTLQSIARLFETSVASIQSWNKLSSTRIVAGQRLTIYTTRAN